MTMLRGTPQTLTKAIKNGVEDFGLNDKLESEDQLIESIRLNVADFIRNKIGPVAMATSQEDYHYIEKLIETLK